MSGVGSEFLEQLCNCEVCFEQFEESGAKQPRMLPCGHTFCLGCIELFCKTANPECPVCRQPISGNVSPDSLPKNFLVIQALGTLKSASAVQVSEAPQRIKSRTEEPARNTQLQPAQDVRTSPSVQARYQRVGDKSIPRDDDLHGDPRIKEGSEVIIHKPADGREGWSSGMDGFDGERAIVERIQQPDSQGYSTALLRHHDVVLSAFSFRVCNLELVEQAPPGARLTQGMYVRIHRPTDNKAGWHDGLNQYDGKIGIVKDIQSGDGAGTQVATLEVDGQILGHQFHVSELEIVDQGARDNSLEGDSRIGPGSTVIVHRHRVVNGSDNWNPNMGKYVGKQAVVESIIGRDSKGCRMARIAVGGQPVSTYGFRVRDLELVTGTQVADSLEGDPRIKVGSQVIVHRHREVDGSTNWASGMDQYVGKQARVAEITGKDSKGCRTARLFINGDVVDRYVFRVRDLVYVAPSAQAPGTQVADSLEGDPRIKVGSQVVVNKHREVDGSTNWVSGMDQYVGKQATVAEFTGKDSKGCRMVRLRIDGQVVDRYVFRARDLTLCQDESLDGDSRIVEGSQVIIHKHREIDGDANWASGMNKYIGKTAVVKRFAGHDRSGSRVARLECDGQLITSYTFRVRDLEYVAAPTEQTDSLEGDSRIVVGSEVIIRKHRAVDGATNWVDSMDSFIGKHAVVKSFTGHDSKGCRVAKVECTDADASKFVFRVRDLEYVAAPTKQDDSLEGDSRIVVGSKVVIHKHRELNGEINWVSGMDQYVGKQGTVVKITGKDNQGCRTVRLMVDGTVVPFYFRARDLTLCQQNDSLNGDSRIGICSKVIVHRHREVDGVSNWVPEMEKYVGQSGVVEVFNGKDRQGCRTARLVINGQRVPHSFRVRDLEYVAGKPELDDSLDGDSRIVVGSRVVIRKHRAVDGATNWVSGMDQYVGKTAVVKSLPGRDLSGCRVAKVECDGQLISPYMFRVRDLSLEDDLEGDSRIVVGSRVVIRKHRAVNGATNWVSAMDKYDLRTGEVTKFTGHDLQKCRMVRLKVDGTELPFYFRVRDLTLVNP